MLHSREWLMLALLLAAPLTAECANVITDWDEKAVAFVPASAEGERQMAIVHVAMFDAVNSIEPRYRPYATQLPAAPGTSKEAAAAAAAGMVLSKLLPNAAPDVCRRR